MIYQPAEDSFLLEKEVRKRARGRRVLDVGCGSGVQMKAALESGAERAQGVDIDSESVAFCRANGFDVSLSNLFEAVTGRFDLIVFNPPYLPEDEREDTESARVTSGGKRGDEILVRFLQAAGDYLEQNGLILLVVSSLTPLEEIERVLKEKGFSKEVVASENIFMEQLEVWEITQFIDSPF